MSRPNEPSSSVASTAIHTLRWIQLKYEDVKIKKSFFADYSPPRMLVLCKENILSCVQCQILLLLSISLSQQNFQSEQSANFDAFPKNVAGAKSLFFSFLNFLTGS